MEFDFGFESFDASQTCTCPSPNPDARKLYFHENVVWGEICGRCKTECLFHENWPGENVHAVDEADGVERDSKLLESKVKIRDQVHARQVLEPGSHIFWVRYRGVYHHHALVLWMNFPSMIIIHFGKEEKGLKVAEEQLDMEGSEIDFANMYLVTYQPEIERHNPSGLVLARALSRIGETAYDLITNNCETFARFCKSGLGLSLQVKRTFYEAKEFVENNLSMVLNGLARADCIRKVLIKSLQNSSITSEVVEKFSIGQGQGFSMNLIGGVVLVLVETGLLAYDVGNLYLFQESNQMSKEDFNKKVFERILKFIFRAGVGLPASIAGGLVGAEAGALAGSVVPLVGTGFGAFVGGLVGSVTGAVGAMTLADGALDIRWSFSRSEDISSIYELKRGDHIITYGNVAHPRCHALLTDVNYDEGEITIIRNTKQDGIRYDVIHDIKDMKRIRYLVGECYGADEVIRRAEREVGKSKYFLPTYNCKDFAREMKMREECNIS